MSVDFAKSPLDNLMEMLNANSSVVAAVGDFMEINPPVALTGDASGRNTKVSLRTSMSFSHAGRVEVLYDRRPLLDMITSDVNVTVDDFETFTVVMDMYRRKYGVYLDQLDIQPDEPFDVSGGELSYQIAVTAPETSYGYYGSAVMTVNVNWRLDDPELVENELERLRQFVQFTLPSAVRSTI